MNWKNLNDFEYVLTENDCVGLSVSNLFAEYWSPSIPISKIKFPKLSLYDA